MSAAILLAVSTTAAMLAVSLAYPSGAPAKDCWTERPLHGDNMPAHGDSPYRLVLTKVDPSASADTYRPGEYIHVTIESRDTTPFKGYLVKVSSSNGVSAGSWGARKTEQHVLRGCGVTHNNNSESTRTSLMWRAPLTPIMNTIQFRAIVVKDYTVFYNNILSRHLRADYPQNFLDRLFKRLKAYAHTNFNVSMALPPGTETAVTSTQLASSGVAAPSANGAPPAGSASSSSSSSGRETSGSPAKAL